MPNPIITPYATPNTAYQVSDSDTAYYDLSLSNLGDVAEFIVSVPNGAEVSIWALAVANPWSPSPADTRTLFNGSTWSGASLAGWSISVSPGTPAVISVSQGSGPAAGSLRLRITNIRTLAPTGTASLTAQTNAETVRIVADPSISGTPPATGSVVFEGNDFVLGATLAVTEQHGVVPAIFGALPAVTGGWTPDPSELAIAALLGTSPTFHAPGVYENTPVGFALLAFYDFNGSGTFDAGEPSNDAHVELTIQRANHRMILALDSSGSMGGTLQQGDSLSRWDAAVRAAHVWVDVFSAMRGGQGQKVGILTFEHDGCAWEVAAQSSDIRLRNPSNGAGINTLEDVSAYATRTNLNVGDTGSCTPIGDAVVKAAQALVGTANGINTPSPQASDYLSLVVLTDGYENSGNVTIRNSAPAGHPGVATLTNRLAQSEFDALDSDRFKLYTIGVGSSVDEDALDAMPSTTVPSGSGHGYYRLALDLADFGDVLGQMLGDTIDAQQVEVSVGGTEATFDLNPGERRLVVVVPWDVLTHTIKLSHRAQGSSDPWTDLVVGTHVVLSQRVHHGMITVDLPAVFDGSAPARQWRVQHLSGSTPQTLSAVLAYVDLHVKAFLTFDRESYRTGQPIELRCELREGSRAIEDAVIRVEIDAPGTGLGTYLSTHTPALAAVPITQLGSFFGNAAVPVFSTRASHVDPATGAVVGKTRGDPLAPKAALFQAFLAEDKLRDLPRAVRPRFADGTDRLHAVPGKRGSFANAFDRSFKEGTYTFRVVAEGKLADGSRFSRKLSVSKWVGVRPSVTASNVGTIALPSPGDGRLALWVAVQPLDERGEYLGPFRESEVVFHTTAGSFEGDVVSTVDGTYYRKLVYAPGDMPVIQVSVAGTPLRPTLTFEPDLCLGFDEICRHFQACKHHFVGLVECTVHVKGLFHCATGLKGSFGRLCKALTRKCCASSAGKPQPAGPTKAKSDPRGAPCRPCEEQAAANAYRPAPPKRYES